MKDHISISWSSDKVPNWAKKMAKRFLGSDITDVNIYEKLDTIPEENFMDVWRIFRDYKVMQYMTEAD